MTSRGFHSAQWSDLCGFTNSVCVVLAAGVFVGRIDIALHGDEIEKSSVIAQRREAARDAHQRW
jgi:hypothetical protein